MRFFALITALILAHPIQAQKGPVIDYESYITMVREHHPLSRVADIRLESGKEMLRAARGAFDPKVQTQLGSKDFDGKRYYSLFDAGIEVPTWLGIKITGDYSQNQGVFLNPEHTTPERGLLQAGLSITLGEGLFIDERRAGLRKAELAQELAIAQRELMLNELLLEAGFAYWNWFRAHYAAEVYQEAVGLASDRYEAVKQSAVLGDRPYIDTLEASIQLQARSLQLQEATLNKQNAQARLAVYLWLEGEIPLTVDPNSEPPSPESFPSLPTDLLLIAELDKQIDAHPLMNAQMLEIEQAKVDQRWKREQLKPQVDLKYNALTEAVGSTELGGFNANNYVLGMTVSMPILLRKERGELNLANLKIEEKQLSLATKRQDIRMKARIAINDWNLTSQQVDLFEGTTRDYGALLEGERELFNQGESSLFLVNTRESRYVNARVKLIELKAKNRIAELKALYALSLINQES